MDVVDYDVPDICERMKMRSTRFELRIRPGSRDHPGTHVDHYDWPVDAYFSQSSSLLRSTSVCRAHFFVQDMVEE
jgi:hypothetical protein